MAYTEEQCTMLKNYMFSCNMCSCYCLERNNFVENNVMSSLKDDSQMSRYVY